MRARVSFLVLVLAVVAWTASPPLLRAAGRFLVVEQPPRHADAIVVLSGSIPDRILEAVDLFRAGLAPVIVLCGEPANEGIRQLGARGVTLPWGHELNASIAVQLGVPEEALIVVDRPPGSTFTEARAIIDGLVGRGARSMLLVTSEYHTRRAGMIYRHVSGGSIEVITRPARSGTFDPNLWWHDRMTIRRVLIEYQKLAMFQLWDRWKRVQSATAVDGSRSGSAPGVPPDHSVGKPQ